jgi:hypothetical protein
MGQIRAGDVLTAKQPLSRTYGQVFDKHRPHWVNRSGNVTRYLTGGA